MARKSWQNHGFRHEKPLSNCSLAVYRKCFVELVGFEPTSAQGNHVLSTCLFQPSVFVQQQDLDHQLLPYPQKFHYPCGAAESYFRFILHRWISGFGTTSSERCLVASPCDAIKPVTYCTSVRQRERNCFRQLIFVHHWLWSRMNVAPHAYTPSRLAVKSSQPHI